MYVFLKSISLYGVTDLLHLVNSCTETKKHLKQLVENGVQHKTVGRLCKETPKAVIENTK